LPGGIEGNHREPHSRKPVSGMRVELNPPEYEMSANRPRYMWYSCEVDCTLLGGRDLGESEIISYFKVIGKS
jgi:hypothetical protein